MPSRDLYTDAQAIAALYGLTDHRLATLPKHTARILATAKRDLESSDRLLMRAGEREADLVLVYEPTMDYPDDSTPETRFVREDGVWLTESFEDNPESARWEPKGSLLTNLAMRERASQLRAGAASVEVKRALAGVK